MIRLFKPGDRVELRSGGPRMIVQKYVMRKNPLVGAYHSKEDVLCSWLDPVEGRKEQVFSQWALMKSPPVQHRINNRRPREYPYGKTG